MHKYKQMNKKRKGSMQHKGSESVSESADEFRIGASL